MGRKKRLPDGLYERSGVYYSRFRMNGKQVRKRLSTDLAAATSILNTLKARADRAEFDLIDNDLPIADLKDQWLRYCDQTLRPDTVKRYRENLANVFALMNINRVSQVTIGVATTYRQDRLAKPIPSKKRDAKTANVRYPSNRTVNMELAALSTMLAWGVEHKLIGSNPLEKLKALPTDEAKEGRALSTDEVRRLLKASTEPYGNIWYAYLTTGLRRDELAELLLTDIDWEGRELIVRGSTAKNHTPRRVPIDDKLYETLLRRRQTAGMSEPGTGRDAKTAAKVRARFSRLHAFVTAQGTPVGGNLYREFMRTCKRAGIETQTLDADGGLVEHVDLHSLRRTFATDLITNGVDPKTTQTLLGHKRIDMTLRLYTRIRSQNKRQAVARLSYGAGAQSPDGIVQFPSAATA